MELTKQFFKDNPLDELPFPALIDFRIDIFEHDSLEDAINEIADSMITKKQRETNRAEIEAVRSIRTVDELIQAMRKYKGPNTEHAIANKALSMEETALPKIVELFYRNKTSEFLEKAEFILYFADRKYLDELFRNYKQIQSPYARAMICFLIGKAEYVGVDDFLLEQYLFMKQHYEQFPLFALYNLHPDLANTDEEDENPKKKRGKRRK